ncbi:hypothetical protein PILCRDRAFT_716765 [Piloderma croceum F 1598]|uniref:Uncharacterized protein n=1 Tax=Piloderma croceum (strain F 1598) TaxID=765440 RepID=A0A0C3F1A8_PILCF|nr:hypothetical protein PILCRDRAFT_716765 [Piloderma croceum F 1598]
MSVSKKASAGPREWWCRERSGSEHRSWEESCWRLEWPVDQDRRVLVNIEDHLCQLPHAKTLKPSSTSAFRPDRCLTRHWSRYRSSKRDTTQVNFQQTDETITTNATSLPTSASASSPFSHQAPPTHSDRKPRPCALQGDRTRLRARRALYHLPLLHSFRICFALHRCIPRLHRLCRLHQGGRGLRAWRCLGAVVRMKTRRLREGRYQLRMNLLRPSPLSYRHLARRGVIIMSTIMAVSRVPQ